MRSSSCDPWLGNANSFVTLRLTNRINLAELSTVGCAHITVRDKQQFYWVHFNLLGATQLYDLEGKKGAHTVVPTQHTPTQHNGLRSEEHIHRQAHTGDTPRYL